MFKFSISGPLINSNKKSIKIFTMYILFSFSISKIRKINLITLLINSFSKSIIFCDTIFSSNFFWKFNKVIKNSNCVSSLIL